MSNYQNENDQWSTVVKVMRIYTSYYSLIELICPYSFRKSLSPNKRKKDDASFAL